MPQTPNDALSKRDFFNSLQVDETVEQFAEGVGARLAHYAGRGAFRAFTPVGPSDRWSRKTAWQVTWHMDHQIQIVADSRKRLITLRNVLPKVDRKHPLDRDLRVFVTDQTGAYVLPHRRLAMSRNSIRVINRKGEVSISLKAEAGADAKTQTDRAVSLCHQIYTVFLREGGYDDYLAEAFGVDMDAHM